MSLSAPVSRELDIQIVSPSSAMAGFVSLAGASSSVTSSGVPQGSFGLDRVDRRTGAVTHYRHDPADPASLSHDRVSSIYEDRAGRLWVALPDNPSSRSIRTTSRPCTSPYALMRRSWSSRL